MGSRIRIPLCLAVSQVNKETSVVLPESSWFFAGNISQNTKGEIVAGGGVGGRGGRLDS